jgi:hypothetical protein
MAETALFQGGLAVTGGSVFAALATGLGIQVGASIGTGAFAVSIGSAVEAVMHEAYFIAFGWGG